MTTEKKRAFSTLDLAYMSLAAALIAVCAWISIPTAVPFTMQTFAMFFALSLLGGRRGTLAILLYILLGCAGLPVFSGFKAGIGVLLGNTGGYIAGFVLAGLIYWLLVGRLGKKMWAELLAMALGLIACYALGTAWFMIVYARANGAVSLGAVLSWCVLPFILPDLIKMALAVIVARRIAPAMRLSA